MTIPASPLIAAPRPIKEPLARALVRSGWAWLPGAGDAGLAATLEVLGGRVIDETDVAIREGRALVTSDRALDLHTDHHGADFIVWRCLCPSSAGGVSLLADAEAAFLSLSPSERAALSRLELFEHRVFPGDRDVHPFVEQVDGRLRFYCSFWFDDDLDASTRAAFGAFREAVNDHRVASVRLETDDLLVVDNRRILHGRTAITGSRDRHLVRRWISTAGRGSRVLGADGGHDPKIHLDLAQP